MKEFYYELWVVPSSYAELFADFLLQTTQEAIEEREIDGKSAFIVYGEEPPHALLAQLDSFVATLCERLDEDISYTHSLAQKPNRDWIESYKQSVMPVVCGDFAVRPSWHEKNALCASGALVDIVIDPALAFGSGHHESTAMCLEILSGLDVRHKRVLDVGCGSGVLGIAAAKRGAHVFACDTDSLAVSETQKNFINNTANLESLWCGSMEQAEGSYALIMANLLAVIVIALYEPFCAHSQKGSLLLLSGILQSARESVMTRFAGFSLYDERIRNEWVALLLCKD